MNDVRSLTPREAEAVIDDCIERFGLGALPRVSVTEQADGTWRVRWDQFERSVTPMTEAAWRAWVEENIGSLDPGDLETTEA